MIETKTENPAKAADRRINIQPWEGDVRSQYDSDIPLTMAIELFQPEPNVLYSLDEIAHLAGVSRRSILVYLRADLLRPVFQEPYEVMAFTEEAVHTVRRIEHVRAVHGVDVAWVKIMFDLLDEVETLRAEVSFLRRY